MPSSLALLVDDTPPRRQRGATAPPRRVVLLLREGSDRGVARTTVDALGAEPVVVGDVSSLLEADLTPTALVVDAEALASQQDQVARIKHACPRLRIIVAYDSGDPCRVIEAFQLPVSDHLPRPLARDALRRALTRPPAPTGPPPTTTKKTDEPLTRSARLIGRHPAMLDLFAHIARVACAPTRSTVLVTGETGVGKSLVVRLLHEASASRNHPLATVHCSGVPTELLSNELFGHERGAYTGAERGFMGRIEAAGDGTLFLDEIGELSPEMQVKLLRLLDAREYERLGSTHTRIARCRFVAATHRDLAREVEAGRFRRDLYHRLRVIELSVPPLRERAEDIPLLCQAMLGQLAVELGRPLVLEERALALLLAAEHRGNVRELRHLLEEAAVLAPSGHIDAALVLDLLRGRGEEPGLPASPTQEDPTAAASSSEAAAATRAADRPGTAAALPRFEQARSDALARFEAEYVEAALRWHGGNVSRAAEGAGVSRQYLQRLIKRHGVRPRVFRSPPGP